MRYCAELVDLSVSFQKKAAINNINVNIPAEGITVLLGRSGSGKTTFLRSLNRLNETFDGYEGSGSVKVLIDGKNREIYSSDAPPLTELRRRIGMVFQIPNPLPMSIRRNLQLPLQLVLGLDRKEAEARMETALRSVGLWDEVADRLDEQANRFSGGQQQRLCLARTLALKPDMLLLDEPTASLDRKSSELIEEHLLSLRGKYPMIMVSHNLTQALRLGTHFIILSEGKLNSSIPSEEIDLEKDAERFLGNLL